MNTAGDSNPFFLFFFFFKQRKIISFSVADKGKPWFMYEAYQLVMKAQVEFLVGRGVNPALKVFIFVSS